MDIKVRKDSNCPAGRGFFYGHLGLVVRGGISAPSFFIT